MSLINVSGNLRPSRQAPLKLFYLCYYSVIPTIYSDILEYGDIAIVVYTLSFVEYILHIIIIYSYESTQQAAASDFNHISPVTAAPTSRWEMT